MAKNSLITTVTQDNKISTYNAVENVVKSFSTIMSSMVATNIDSKIVFVSIIVVLY